MNKFRFSLRFQFILVIFSVLLLCLACFSILFAVLSISRTASTQKAAQLFEETGFRLEAQLNRQLDRAVQLSRLFSALPELSAPIEGDGTASPLVPFMAKALESYPNLYSLYTGGRDGDFLQFIHAAGDPGILKAHQAPGSTWFILRTISVTSGGASDPVPDRKEYWTFLNREMVPMGSRRVDNPEYDPAGRIWFVQADTSGNQVSMTEPYLFHSLKAPGITASVRAGKDCVIGVDITLGNLKTYLEQINISPGTGLLIIDKKNRILAASSRMEDWLGIRDSSLKQLEPGDAKTGLLLGRESSGTASMRVTEDGDMIWNQHWKDLGSLHYKLILVTPMSDFTGHLAAMKKRIIVTTLCLILLIFPLVILSSRYLSRFMEVLARDAGRVQKFEFGHHIPGHSLVLEFEQLASAYRLMKQTISDRTRALETTMEKLRRIIGLGIGMSVERDSDRLVELILKGAKDLSNADGGSLYLKSGDRPELNFKIVLTDSVNIAQGGTSGRAVTMPSVPLYDGDGEPNTSNVVTYAYHTGQTVSIDDVYSDKNFKFTGTREFDEMNHYRSQSFLTVPLKVQGGEVLGALQLINSICPETGRVVPFSPEIQKLVEALSAEAASVLYQRGLTEAQRRLFESLIRLIADAIDIKSPYTGRHCARVPELAAMLAKEAEKCDHGPLADFRFESDDDRRAFELGAWLHDAGKMTTPEFVVDKGVKLETIYNRIHEIRTRFEVILRDIRLEEKKALLEGADPATAGQIRQEKEQQLKEDFSFVAQCNIGSEEMAPKTEERLHKIAQRTWVSHFDKSMGLSIEEAHRLGEKKADSGPTEEQLLADRPEHIIPFSVHPSEVYGQYNFQIPKTDCLYNRGELHNLLVTRGTLTQEERFKINEHIMQTSIMLDHLPFPPALKKVPEYAVTHHETLSGTGYPRGLAEGDLSVPSRILAIADIFEALTASDRPYKKAKKLSEALAILYRFKQDRHIDPDLFDLFLTSGVYLEYARQFFPPEQIDEVDIGQFLD